MHALITTYIRMNIEEYIHFLLVVLLVCNLLRSADQKKN